MKKAEYGKEFARKVFELIESANFIAVDRGAEAWWYGEKPIPEASQGKWCSVWDIGKLGKVVNYGDWRYTLISRADVGMEKGTDYGKDFARRVFNLIPGANYVVVDGNGSAWWSFEKPTPHLSYRGWYCVPCSRFLGRVVNYGDWKKTMISRADIEGAG